MINSDYFLQIRFDKTQKRVLMEKPDMRYEVISLHKTTGMKIPYLFKETLACHIAHSDNQWKFYDIIFKEVINSIYYNLYDDDDNIDIRQIIVRILQKEKRLLIK